VRHSKRPPFDPEETVSERTQLKRNVLLIPYFKPIGLTTYDAKDPATSFEADAAG
jgi:hypothetical protein